MGISLYCHRGDEGLTGHKHVLLFAFVEVGTNQLQTSTLFQPKNKVKTVQIMEYLFPFELIHLNLSI